MYCVFPEKSSEEEILGEFVKYIDQVNGEIEGRRSETGSCWGYLIIYVNVASHEPHREQTFGQHWLKRLHKQ